MGRVVSEAQWLAARQLSEVEPPTRARLAAILGVDVTRLCQRASVEGWKTPDFRNQALAGLYREARTVAAAIAADKSGEFGAEADQADGDAAGFESGDAEAGGSPADPHGRQSVPPAEAPAPVIQETRDPVELLAQASGFVARQVTRLMQHADRSGGRLDKAQVDGLAALARMMERWETLAQERAIKEEQDSDDDLADALRWINDRIVELARAEADRLVAAGYGAQDGEARP
jgi:hypothetical protein